jgi:hypothetical protein
MRWIITCCLILQGALNVCPVCADDIKDSATFIRIKASIVDGEQQIGYKSRTAWLKAKSSRLIAQPNNE